MEPGQLIPHLQLRVKNKMTSIKELETTMEEQVLLVGSEALFERVIESFHEEIVDIFFIKEQIALYKWRKEFFKKHFPAGTWRTDCNFLCTLGMCEEFHNEAAIHYNILNSFETVMGLAYTKPKQDDVFFSTDYFCTYFSSKYDFSNSSDSEIVNQLFKVEFSCAIHLLCGHFSSSPV